MDVLRRFFARTRTLLFIGDWGPYMVPGTVLSCLMHRKRTYMYRNLRGRNKGSDFLRRGEAFLVSFLHTEHARESPTLMTDDWVPRMNKVGAPPIGGCFDWIKKTCRFGK